MKSYHNKQVFDNDGSKTDFVYQSAAMIKEEGDTWLLVFRQICMPRAPSCTHTWYSKIIIHST